jgi:hypothetical protein
VWSFANPLPTVVPGDWLTIRTNCPGLLVWQFDDRPPNSQTMQPVGGVMAGARRFQLLIGRVEMDVQRITFRFHCETHNGEPHDACCHPDTQVIEIRGHLANADGRTDADRGKGMHGQNERA